MTEKKACSIIEAEEKVKDFIKNKHDEIKSVHVAMMFPKRKFWVVKGDLSLKRLQSVSNVPFKAQVSMNTGEVTSYEETSLKHPKRRQGSKVLGLQRLEGANGL